MEVRQSPDPEVWLRGGAQISRRIQETCADLLRFMRESGDPALLARFRENQELRLTQEGFLPHLGKGSRHPFARLEESAKTTGSVAAVQIAALPTTCRWSSRW